MSTRFIGKISARAAAAAAVFGLIGCSPDEDSAAWWGGEQKRVELSHQLELKSFRLDQVVTPDYEEFEGLRSSVANNAGHLETLRQRRNGLVDQVDSLEAQRSGFRTAAIQGQRQRAIGRSFDRFDLVSGRQFQKVTISAIDDSGVTVRHSDGSARLRFDDLDTEQRQFFGLEPDLATAAMEKESQDTANYERWIDGQMAALNDKKEKLSADAQREKLENQRQRTELAARQIAASGSRALAQTGTSLSSSPTHFSSSYPRYRTNRTTYRYVYYDNTPNWSHSGACNPMLTRYGARSGAACYVAPTSLPRRQSFADTTLPSIP